ncbi:hypothetical protein [Sodalis ligni]|jgi:hypothetical protein|uniref:Uncharacterized protein n=1 Tax=Sodalis ligni TaxID=2697027 RepID=A0A4R1NL99_9GAMM|nr:hypothetical protein [Sodalis ligni]TCL06731.1 hypothetical protein EZJ58_5021 [Sodalis ligni]
MLKKFILSITFLGFIIITYLPKSQITSLLGWTLPLLWALVVCLNTFFPNLHKKLSRVPSYHKGWKELSKGLFSVSTGLIALGAGIFFYTRHFMDFSAGWISLSFIGIALYNAALVQINTACKSMINW